MQILLVFPVLKVNDKGCCRSAGNLLRVLSKSLLAKYQPIYEMERQMYHFIFILFLLLIVLLVLNPTLRRDLLKIGRPCSNTLTEVAGKNDCGLITADMTGRLGNQMFIYSTLYGISQHNHKRPFISSQGSETLRETFESLTIPVIEWNFYFCPFTPVQPIGVSIFTQSLMELKCGQNTRIVKELQCHQYFDRFWKDIRKEFKFKRSVLDPCQKAIQKAVGHKKNCTLIGVHLRRGDFTRIGKREFGHQPAREDLLNKGIEYFEKKLGSTQCLVFLVLGDDYKWNVENAPNLSNVIVLQPQSASIDFCILANCNHSIRSTGSFGIMSALLANGITVYQKEQARPNSTLDSVTKVRDLIPHKWIPI